MDSVPFSAAHARHRHGRRALLAAHARDGHLPSSSPLVRESPLPSLLLASSAEVFSNVAVPPDPEAARDRLLGLLLACEKVLLSCFLISRASAASLSSFA